MIHPPSHLHYFSQETATLLLGRLGFEDIETRPTPIFRDVKSVLDNLAALNSGVLGKLALVLSRVIPQWIQSKIGCWIDFGDIMMVTARRPSS